MKHVGILMVALLFGSLSELRAQSDSLVDVFSLAVGNQWTYRYFTLIDYAPAGTPIETLTDSGLATYSIAGKIANADSTRWQFRLQRNLMRHQILWQRGSDTTYPVRDTSLLEIIESHVGQHQLYRNADPNLIRLDVFPFTRGFVDTTMIYRFRRVGIGDTAIVQSCVRSNPSPTFRSTFTFQKNIGIIRNRFNTGSVDVFSKNEHFLLHSSITTVPSSADKLQIKEFSLFQNYPNPFNPTTRIEYAIPKTSHVSLKVFDLLGREVATLVDEVQDSGFKSVEFNANELASGVYLYQLNTTGFSETKKLMMIR